MAPTIYMDESGHTGYNYLNAQQTFVAYGSLRTTDEEAVAKKETHFSNVRVQELKHSDLVGTNVGRSAVVRFLQNERDWLGQHFKWFLIEKPHALLSKYVDLILEPASSAEDENLYSSGMAPQLTMMFALSARANKKEENLNRFLSVFNEFARQPDLDRLAELEREAHRLDLGDEKLEATMLFPIQRLGVRLMHIVEKEQLDLSFSGPWLLLDLWYQQVQEPYHMVHDAGAALLRQREQLDSMTVLERGYETRKIGHVEAAINIPLLSKDFRNSADSSALQLVDVVLGAHRRLFEWLKAGKVGDDYAAELHDILGVPEPDWMIPPPIEGLLQIEKDDQTAAEATAILVEVGERIPERRRFDPSRRETS